MKLTWFVVESAVGAVTLFVSEEEELLYVHTGYQYYAPEALRKDVASLLQGEDPSLWAGNNLLTFKEKKNLIEREGRTTLPKLKPEEIPFAPTEVNIKSKIIYDQDGPKTKNMGAAGKRIFAELIEGDNNAV